MSSRASFNPLFVARREALDNSWFIFSGSCAYTLAIRINRENILSARTFISNSFHRKRQTLTGNIDRKYTNLYMLVKADDFCRVLDVVVGKFGDVYKPLRMNSHIHKTTEIGDVRDYTWKNHPLTHILKFMDFTRELECLKLLTRVTTRLVKLSHDVVKSRESDGVRDILAHINL